MKNLIMAFTLMLTFGMSQNVFAEEGSGDMFMESASELMAVSNRAFNAGAYSQASQASAQALVQYIRAADEYRNSDWPDNAKINRANDGISDAGDLIDIITSILNGWFPRDATRA